MSGEVWVFAEQRRGELQNITFELLSEGRKIADKLDKALGAVLVGGDVERLAPTLGHYGADKVYLIDEESLAVYSTLPYTAAIVTAANAFSPSILLIGSTSIGKDLAPRIATRMRTGLVGDCLILKWTVTASYTRRGPSTAIGCMPPSPAP